MAVRLVGGTWRGFSSLWVGSGSSSGPVGIGWWLAELFEGDHSQFLFHGRCASLEESGGFRVRGRRL